MTRRSLLASAASSLVAKAAPKRPNIVLVMADDMGFSDLGCYGSEIPTPNLDGLAARGVRFTQFYNAARCCPTRASLLTGLYPHQAGIGHMWRDLGLPAYQGYLNDDCFTIAEALRAAGYTTLVSGKWHVGSERPHWPCDRGFDESYGILGGGSDYFRPKSLIRNQEQFRPAGGEGYYLTDDLSDQAVSMITRHARGERPFFLYLAYTAPHFPIQAPAADVARHRGRYRIGWDELRLRRHRRMVEMGVVDKSWPLSPRSEESPAWDTVEDKDSRDLKMATYAAMIERLDQGVGRVRRVLAEQGAESNTLFLFLSDNGACAETKKDGSTYELPWANASNTPFRKYKHWAYEGGISTPLIASWPGVIRPGTFARETGHVIDLLPTLLEAGGARALEGRLPPEGRSLLPVLRGRAAGGERTLFWEHEGNRAVRRGRWKLVAGYGGEWELYDMAAGRTELNNLAPREPARMRELAAEYERWARRCGVVPWRADWERRFGIPQ